jgi:serine protease AprX
MPHPNPRRRTGRRTGPALLGATTAAACALALAAPGALRADAADLTAGPVQRGIATFSERPTADQVDALRDLGLTVQPMRSLPLVLVAGPSGALAAAVTRGVAQDVYPDERLQYHDTASTNVMSSSPSAARGLRARGFTGKGVTVGVIDSGCDATHPDLADHVVKNEILLSPEYANQQPSKDNTLVVPVDQAPMSNSDLGSGHGTHVAGIIAADSSSVSDGSRLGVAPDAKLACFAIGAVITTTAVVTAFDRILSTKGHFGIDVINNSWGNSFRQFDPRDPVNVATRAAARAGMTVVFSAGNSGYENAQASVSPFNQAPWVISVAAGTVKRQRGDFSSNGLRFDNSLAQAIGAGGHTVATRDRIGLVHPDLTAPGVDISSSCDTTGTVIGPCPPGENAEASGTSMAAPHVAGAAAVLLQAQPRLTPRQVRRAMEATASPVRDAQGDPVPFWQAGYGHVNLDRAVALVRGDGWRDRLAAASARADRRVLGSDAWRVPRSDLFQHDAPPLTLGGSDTRTYKVKVAEAVDKLHVVLVYPTPGTAANLAQYSATVTGPSGRTLGTTRTSVSQSHGTAVVTVPAARAGTYTFTVSGDYAVSDPDTIDSDSVNGRVVFLQVAHLVRD